MRRFGSSRTELLALGAVLLVLLSYLARFLFSPGMPGWDMPAHYLLAKAYRDQIWPFLSGWSPYGFGGYPAGYLYPPLFEWIAGGIGKIFPLMAVFKLLIAASVLALPFSILFFLRGEGYSARERAFSLLLVFSTLALFETPTSMGGTLIATFRAGLTGAQLSLTFFFFYLGFLRKLAKNPRALVPASLLLAAAFLSHGISGTMGMMMLAGGAAFFARNRAQAARLLGHVALVLLLTCGWWIPYLKAQPFGSGVGLPSPHLDEAFPGVPFFIYILTALAAWRIFRGLRERKMELPALLFLESALVLAFLFIFREKYGRTHIGSPLHGFRYAIFFLLAGGMAAGKVLAIPFKRDGLATAALFAFLFYAAIVGHRQTFKSPPVSVASEALAHPPAGRGLIQQGVFSPLTNDLDSPNATGFAAQDQGASILNGTFVESSDVAPFLHGFLRELTPEVFYWFMERAPLAPDQLAAHAELLGLNWILADRALPQSSLAKLPIRSHREIPVQIDGGPTGGHPPVADFQLYELSAEPVELLTKPPLSLPADDWRNRLYQQWVSDPRSILIEQPSENVAENRAENPAANQGVVPYFPPTPGDAVELAESIPSLLRIRISAPQARWVLVKFPYFPDWHAYAGNSEIPLYRASVNEMTFSAQGEVEIRFVRAGSELAAQVISLLAWIACVIAAFVLRRRRQIAAPA